jgi:hypothetical protein
LETPDKDLAQLRQEAVSCLGDFVGLAPTTWADLASEILALEVHPDAQHVVLGLADGSILVRNLATGAEVARLDEHRAPVHSLSLDAAGARMVSRDQGGILKVWQANAGGAWVCTRTMATDRPVPDDKVIWYAEPVSVVLSSDGSLTIWNIPRIRAQLAQIGLDWQDAPLLSAATSEPADAMSEARPVETARLFALSLFETAQATLAVLGNV